MPFQTLKQSRAENAEKCKIFFVFAVFSFDQKNQNFDFKLTKITQFIDARNEFTCFLYQFFFSAVKPDFMLNFMHIFTTEKITIVYLICMYIYTYYI